MKFTYRIAFKPNAASFNYALCLVIVASALFSIKPVMVKWAYAAGVSPDTMMVLRMLFSVPLFLWIGLYGHRDELIRLSLRSVALTALLGVVGYYLASLMDLYGLLYIDAGLERLILYMYPTIVLVIHVLVFKKRIRVTQISCVALSYVGVILFFFAYNTHDSLASVAPQMIETFFGELPTAYWGGALVFASACAFAVYFVGSERMLLGMSSGLYTALAMLSAGLAIVIHYAARHPFSSLLDVTLEGYVVALATAIFCTVLPAFMLSAGIKVIGSSLASVVGASGPVITLVLAALALGESLSISQLFGALIVIIGVVLMGKCR